MARLPEGKDNARFHTRMVKKLEGEEVRREALWWSGVPSKLTSGREEPSIPRAMRSVRFELRRDRR
jgi:hypothetical protein